MAAGTSIGDAVRGCCNRRGESWCQVFESGISIDITQELVSSLKKYFKYFLGGFRRKRHFAFLVVKSVIQALDSRPILTVIQKHFKKIQKIVLQKNCFISIFVISQRFCVSIYISDKPKQTNITQATPFLGVRTLLVSNTLSQRKIKQVKFHRSSVSVFIYNLRQRQRPPSVIAPQGEQRGGRPPQYTRQVFILGHVRWGGIDHGSRWFSVIQYLHYINKLPQII